MIKIKVNDENILITGHAFYDEYGKDIVCSAVSATFLCTVNAILKLDKNALQVRNVQDGKEIKILKKDHVTNVLINNMLDCLKELGDKYPRNIQIKEEEKWETF